MDAYGSTVWRVCVLYFRASADAEDAFQETMIKYATADETIFKEEEHRKAWLIRVATNVCKDMLKVASRSNVSFDEHAHANRLISCDNESQPASFSSEVVDAMRSLDDPPRTPLYLSLYEGYTAPEIAGIVDAPVNTVYSWLARGKTMLKEALS
ncbi:MAG: sigma-70 family RNA polymerase sigma factor [Gordonibacter sp.]|nr:sigma-70 family RNA polymerase sigma factor [Gordonibacter sp.]